MTKQKREFNTVKTFREIKDNISKDLEGLTFSQIKKYLKEKSLKWQAK